ncbi:hypothetical protein HDU93_005417 [Gonapodya sp. JEL0774]|nr:hypothetical protein HDU93_005417 [Gonapodya sp. JEL0774]
MTSPSEKENTKGNTATGSSKWLKAGRTATTLLISHATYRDEESYFKDDADEVPEKDISLKSSFAQTCFNSINMLLGIGILSLPFAFKQSSIIVGALLTILFALMTSFTARILVRCMNDENLGDAAFGPIGRGFIAIFFIFELLVASVALMILAADSINALAPGWNLVLIKIVVGAVVTITTMGNTTKWLSYGSFLGIVSVFFLLFIILYCGFVTTTPPGSILHPSPTVELFSPKNWFTVPSTFGLIMAGYSGHSAFPTLYRDMAEPSRYPQVVTITYAIVATISVALGLTGYLMFGADALHEITLNLPTVPYFNSALMTTTLVLFAINPITKFALAMFPVNISVELFIFPTSTSPKLRVLFRILLRILTSALVVTLSIVLPGFQRVMGVVGSFFSFTVSVVFPAASFLALSGWGGYNMKSTGYSALGDGVEKGKPLYVVQAEPWERVVSWIMVVGGLICAVVGTVWSFL